MRIALFGAGASFGSGMVLPRPPPLGADLFPVLRRLFVTWRSIPESDAGLFVPNFELGMGSVIEKYGMAVPPLMQDMAILCAGFGLSAGTDNLYWRILADSSTRRDIIWSTLNYECLLEIAASLHGRSVDYFGEPTEASPVTTPIWKLHGSCNFKVVGLEAGRGVSFGTGVVFSGGIQAINPSEVRPHYRGATALYPAMALYAKGKTIAMSPEPIRDAQRRWADRVRTADRVLLVGVAPNPADSHIWGPLRDTDALVAYVGARSAWEAWVAEHRRSRSVEFLGERWNSCYGQSATCFSGS